MKEKVKVRRVKGAVPFLNRKYQRGTEESKMNKLSHKLTLVCVKYIPPIVALVDLLSIVLLFIGIDTFLLDYIFGTSVMTLIPMYIMSYAFKFCKYHRMILHYMVANRIVFFIDKIFKLPLVDMSLLLIYIFLAGLFLTFTIYNYLKHGDRNDS